MCPADVQCRQRFRRLCTRWGSSWRRLPSEENVLCGGDHMLRTGEYNINCSVIVQKVKTSSSERFILNARQFQWSSVLLLLRQACLIYKGRLFVYLMVSEV